METTPKELTVRNERMSLPATDLPVLLTAAGASAQFAWDEFFSAQIRNRHTRSNYLRAVRRFLAWVPAYAPSLAQITPGIVGAYFEQFHGSVPTKNLHLSAIRAFFNVLVNRHVCILNPAATVRGERHRAIEGKTPEISRDQARQLLASVSTLTPAGLRNKAIIGTLIYTATRAGAIAGLRLRDFCSDGTQYSLRFREKNGKLRSIPVRHDLQGLLLDYLATFNWQTQPPDTPFFRAAAGRSGLLTERALTNIDICRMVKRCLFAAGLPPNLSPHSFRVATITDLLMQGIALEDVQYLAGHSDPRTTRLYDRRHRQVTRNTVERISI